LNIGSKWQALITATLALSGTSDCATPPKKVKAAL
jgi:hypothetical protein